MAIDPLLLPATGKAFATPTGKGLVVFDDGKRELHIACPLELAPVIAIAPALARFVASFGPRAPCAVDIEALLQRLNVEFVK